MFHGQTAWFSSSVPSRRTRLWKQHEGKVVSLDKAQFVFSDDCQCPDTKRLYESDAYMNEHLAIFHSSYVSECVRKEDIKQVVLGNYFLPPLEVMKVIRGQAKLAWEKHSEEEETDDDDDEEDEDDSEAVDVSQNRHGIENTKSRERRSAEKATSDNKAHRRSPRQNSEKVGPGKSASFAGDIAHIDSLPKVTGILEEFYPGKNGCVVFMKS